MSEYTFKDGRVWFQRKKFEAFELLLPYGLTNVTDPAGGLTQIREPSPTTRRKTVVVDVVQAEPDLAGFQLETRLKKTLNYLVGLKGCPVNFQAHMGHCDRPDNYYSSEIGVHWQRSHRGDLGIDRMAIIQGEANPVAVQVPFSAEVGPIFLDFEAELMSARTINESEAITAMAFLESECLEDCRSQEDAGENGYAVTKALAGSPNNVANVWYTTDKGETWAETSQRPFAGGKDISDVVIGGIRNNHRVVVSCGTAAAGAASIAYADVTTMGTTAWVTVTVGAVNSQYITALVWKDQRHLYAITSDGYVYRSGDGGATWTAVLTSAIKQLNAIDSISYGPNAGQVWVAGDDGTLRQSTDFGTTWSAISAPAALAAADIDALTITPDGTVFIGADNGSIYGSYDWGASWTLLPAQGVTATDIKALAAWGDFEIWAVATVGGQGKLLRSTDGGANFRLWNLNTPTNSGLNCVECVDPNIVFVGGEPQGGVAFISKTRSNILGIE